MEEVSRRLSIPPQRPTNTLRPIGQQGGWVWLSMERVMWFMGV